MDQGFNTNASPTGTPAATPTGAGYPPQTGHPHHSGNKSLIVTVAAVVIALGIGFAGGMFYQKGQATDNTRGDDTSQGTFNGRAGRMGTFGSVTAISGTSITITSQRDSESKTYTVNTSTKVTNGDAAAAITDIKTGDTVAVQTGDDDTIATQISLNPTMGSPGMGGAGGTQPAGSGAAGSAAN